MLSPAMNCNSQTSSSRTRRHVIRTQCHVIRTRRHVIRTRRHVIRTQCHVIRTQCHVIRTQCHVIRTRRHVIPDLIRNLLAPLFIEKIKKEKNGPRVKPGVTEVCPGVTEVCPGVTEVCPGVTDRKSYGSFTSVGGCQSAARCSAITVVSIPPRTLKMALRRIKRGAVALTRSSRI